MESNSCCVTHPCHGSLDETMDTAWSIVQALWWPGKKGWLISVRQVTRPSGRREPSLPVDINMRHKDLNTWYFLPSISQRASSPDLLIPDSAVLFLSGLDQTGHSLPLPRNLCVSVLQAIPYWSGQPSRLLRGLPTGRISLHPCPLSLFFSNGAAVFFILLEFFFVLSYFGFVPIYYY